MIGYILTNKDCPACELFMQEKMPKLKDWPHIDWRVVDCMTEQKEGRMNFPPQYVPSLYFYKDENKQHFPLFTEGLLPDPEFGRAIDNIVKAIEAGEVE